MKLAIPDLVSNSYFPAAAAVALGFFEREGLDVSLHHVSPAEACMAALRDGAADLVGGSAHLPLVAFPDWRGAKLICAQAQGMYWFLVMRKALGIARGELGKLAGRRIAAVPSVAAALKRLLIAAGLDPERAAISIGPPPGATGPGVNFGVAAARAMAAGEIDGFFANGMGAALAVESGAGAIVLDVRRGDGPRECFNYTMPAIAATERLIADRPEVAAASVRAIVRTQRALKDNPALAAEAGRKLFPPREAALIEELVRRDLPYYDAAISREFVAAMGGFARDIGLIDAPAPYERVVATQFAHLWREG